VVGAEVYAPLAPAPSSRSGPVGIAWCALLPATTDRAGQASGLPPSSSGVGACSVQVRSRGLVRERRARVLSFARFGRPHPWRIACSDSNGRCPAGLPARPAAFTTDGADADPPRAVSPTALEELWSKRDRRLTSPVASRARITGSSRLTAAAGAAPCDAAPADWPARPGPPGDRPVRDSRSTDRDAWDRIEKPREPLPAKSSRAPRLGGSSAQPAHPFAFVPPSAASVAGSPLSARRFRSG